MKYSNPKASGDGSVMGLWSQKAWASTGWLRDAKIDAMHILF